MEHITTIIFDADHTLYTPDSDAAYASKFRFLAEHTRKKADGIRKAWETIMAQATQSADPGDWERKQLIQETLEKVGAPADDRIVNEAYSVFWDNVAEHTTANGAVNQTLQHLKQADYNLAVATDEFPEPLRIKLNAVLYTDIEDVFDTVVTCRDTGTQKPSEKFYTRILDELGVTAHECVMVGDSWVRDLHPAQELGMTTVLLERPEHDQGDVPVNPDHRIKTIDDLEALLLED